MPIFDFIKSGGGGFNTAADYTVTGNWEFNNTVVEVDAALVINGAATLYSDGGQFIWNDGGVQFNYAQNLIDQLQVNSNLTVNGPFSCDNNQIFSDGNGTLYFADGNYGIGSNGGGYFYQFASDNGLISSDASGNLTTQTLYIAGTLLGYNQQTILDQYSNISTSGTIIANSGFIGDGSNLTGTAYNLTAGDALDVDVTSSPIDNFFGNIRPGNDVAYQSADGNTYFNNSGFTGDLDAINIGVGYIFGNQMSGAPSFPNGFHADNVIILSGAYQQTTDPANPGQVWNNNGVLTFSNG